MRLFTGASGTAAYAINARGDIVGPYVDGSHKAHGFLRSPGHAPVPVSGTFSNTLSPVSVRQVDGNTGVFTGTVAGRPGSVNAEVRGRGTFASLIATARFESGSGTGGLRGLRGPVKVTGAATGPTTLAGSYEGQGRFEAAAADDD